MDHLRTALRPDRPIQKQAVLWMFELLVAAELKQRLGDEVGLDRHGLPSPSSSSSSSSLPLSSSPSKSSAWSSSAVLGTILPSSSSSVGSGGSVASYETGTCASNGHVA